MKNYLLLFFLITNTLTCLSQENESKKLELSGYVSSLQSALFDSLQGDWITESLIHNRLNLKWYASNTVTGALEVRNRFIFGESIKMNPASKATYDNDNGFADLSVNLFNGKSYLLNTAIDRFWLAYEKNKWRITLGRQRINWSQTWVWNPNDIFNAYSFFDFDYAERPGSDALRIQYYNSEVSSTEFAIKLNNQKQVTAAGYYKFNKWNYDFQVIGGILDETDFVIGTGWSGALKRLAVRGEISYFIPYTNSQTSDLLLASLALDYTFGNSLSLMSEFLFNSSVSLNINDILSVYNAPLNVKYLSFVTYNWLMQVSCPVTPLLKLNMAGMYIPQVSGYYLGPSLSYSASDNLEFSLYLQSFRGKIKNDSSEFQKIRLNIFFLRAKISF